MRQYPRFNAEAGFGRRDSRLVKVCVCVCVCEPGERVAGLTLVYDRINLHLASRVGRCIRGPTLKAASECLRPACIVRRPRGGGTVGMFGTMPASCAIDDRKVSYDEN
jgi:hypothetical protein